MLDKGNIIAAVLVNLRGIPLSEAVGADALIAQIIADKAKLLLYGSLADGEDQIAPAYLMAQTVVFNILLNDKRDGEYAVLIICGVWQNIV